MRLRKVSLHMLSTLSNMHFPGASRSIYRRLDPARRHHGFSLVEMLVSIFILGTGMLMVAGVFPVAIKWTNQDTERTVAQIVATNALGSIESQYAGSTPPQVIGPYPYAFGTPHPFIVQGSATQPGNASYYWSAYLAPVANPGGSPGTDGTTYRISIFVFSNPDPSARYPTSATSGGGAPLTTDGVAGYPQLFYGPLRTVATSSSNITGAMPIGALGVDMNTGSTFHLIVDPTTHVLTMSDLPPGTTPPDDYVIYAPPPTGRSESPLIYVFQTTVNL
jgi:prepilin-type N-terminal cleavage/methylation domain-containing protein